MSYDKVIIFDSIKMGFVHVQIKSNPYFFVEPVIINFDLTSISFVKPDLDYMGKTSKFFIRKDGWVRTTLMADIPLGKYPIDYEESNEDKLIAYFE